MRYLTYCLVVLVALTGPIGAQAPAEVSTADRATIRGIIEGQMAAFQRDDGAAAFAFASPAIQAIFGTPDNFLAMVRSGYAAVYRPRAVAFESIIAGDVGQPVQLVRVVGPDGEAVIAAYEMTRLADGTWRINGCVLLKAPERAV
jgi:hypothetical protein